MYTTIRNTIYITVRHVLDFNPLILISLLEKVIDFSNKYVDIDHIDLDFILRAQHEFKMSIQMNYQSDRITSQTFLYIKYTETLVPLP